MSRSIIIGAVLLTGQAGAANAADLGTYKPAAPPMMEVPEPVAAQRDVYLRGYIGMTNQETDGFTNDVIRSGDFNIINHGFDSSPLVGFGIGMTHSDRFRFDLTGEYRGKASFNGLDTFTTGCTVGSGTCTNEYRGFKSDWLFLANAYWDVTTWRGITPYVGAGVGLSEITLHDFEDANQVAGGLHWADDNSEWNFAWALHAGMAYEIAPDLTLDLGYRYASLGDAKTGKFTTFDSSVTSPGPLELEDITSHDVMVGLRWRFGHDDMAMPFTYK